ncbi:hypothetical protein [Vibrio phage vB_VpS_CA8]|nr:hypothetical protein [Vibrio phage vB_VpS_CA8]UFK27010.1 hypothetical protein [Vibrio phage vB_VpaS_AL-2]
MHSLPKAASMWKRKQYEEATKAVQTMFNHIKRRDDFDYGFSYAFRDMNARILVADTHFTLICGSERHSVPRNKDAGVVTTFTGR